jgi:hypothetical protein
MAKTKKTRKFGVVFRKVEKTETPQSFSVQERYNIRPTGMCECGKSNAECAEYWDKRIGVAGRGSDSAGGTLSEYQLTIRRSRELELAGEDPYHFKMFLNSLGNSYQWTPKAPDISLDSPWCGQ